MGQITTGVGLISGLNIADIVDQLIAIDGRTKRRVEQRNTVLQSQQAALQAINSKLLNLKLRAGALTRPTTFRPTSASSSNEGILTASSTSTAIPGTYTFRVQRLVSSQQLITRGFADKDQTPVGEGTLTFERGEARLASNTLLNELNGGDGIQRGHIRVTDRNGASSVIDLTAAVTVDDVIDAINNATNINVIASVDGDGLRLDDNTSGTGNLVVQNLGATQTATSLGIVGSAGDGIIQGGMINSVGRNTFLTRLNDGNGVGSVRGKDDMAITASDGTELRINLDGVTNLGQLIDRINQHADNQGKVVAAISDDGLGLKLTDTTGGGAGFSVAALNNSTAAADLGILGNDGNDDGDITSGRLVAGINSKLLRQINGGMGIDTPGTISITNRNGVATDVDLSSAVSISDVINAINQANAGVTASLNNAGSGLQLTDTTGGMGDMVIADVNGTSAADLKLAGTYNSRQMDSGSLRFQYVTHSTRLDSLGVQPGRITITDSRGIRSTIDLSDIKDATIGDVIQQINDTGLTINARINDTGNGIVLEDTGPGNSPITVEDSGSTTARDLGLRGQAEAPGENLVGTFERTISLTGSETLQDVAKAINDASIGVAASIINDGSAGAPYRLSLSSRTGGAKSAFVFDDNGMGFNTSMLSEARDAVVFYGGNNASNSVLVTSSSNTLDNMIPGVSVNLKSTSNEVVQVNVSRNVEAVVESVNGFIEGLNDIVKDIDEKSKFNSETNERGLLLGESSIAQVRRELFNIILSRNSELTGQYQSLQQVGVRVVDGGTRVELDEERFRQAFSEDPDAVVALFSLRQTEEDDEGNEQVVASGIGVKIDRLLNRLTDPEFGPIESRVDAIERQIELNKRRIDDLNRMLDSKRARYEAQFLAMERALASMQSQSNALANFQPIQFNNNNSRRGVLGNN